MTQSNNELNKRNTFDPGRLRIVYLDIGHVRPGLRSGGVRVFVIMGLPGTGKTTFARRLQRGTGKTTPMLRTDVVRKNHFEQPTYSKSETDLVYSTIAGKASHAPEPVIVEGTFSDAHYRDMVASAKRNVMFFLVTCDEDEAKRRLNERSGGLSDATPEIYDEIKESFDEVERPHYVVDTNE